MNLAILGIRHLSRGLRKGNTPLALLGAALLAVAVVRRLDRSDGRPIYSARLRSGESLRVSLVPPAD